jgi:FixJ family two-component response regulator
MTYSAASATLPESERPLVIIVDDNMGVRDALRNMLASVGLDSVGLQSADELIALGKPERPGCMILDVRLPRMSGLDLQDHLTGLGITMPIIFMTGFGDIPMSVRAIKAGAVDFLTKPFRDQDMLEAITTALERDAKGRQEIHEHQNAITLARALTPRERDVMAEVTKGSMNKQVAYDLGISEVTVKLHRGNVMRKMNARTVVDLVRLSRLIG